MTPSERSDIWQRPTTVIIIRPAPQRGVLAEVIEPRKGELRLGAETYRELFDELANRMRGRDVG